MSSAPPQATRLASYEGVPVIEEISAAALRRKLNGMPGFDSIVTLNAIEVANRERDVRRMRSLGSLAESTHPVWVDFDHGDDGTLRFEHTNVEHTNRRGVGNPLGIEAVSHTITVFPTETVGVHAGVVYQVERGNQTVLEKVVGFGSVDDDLTRQVGKIFVDEIGIELPEEARG